MSDAEDRDSSSVMDLRRKLCYCHLPDTYIILYHIVNLIITPTDTVQPSALINEASSAHSKWRASQKTAAGYKAALPLRQRKHRKRTVWEEPDPGTSAVKQSHLEGLYKQNQNSGIIRGPGRGSFTGCPLAKNYRQQERLRKTELASPARGP